MTGNTRSLTKTSSNPFVHDGTRISLAGLIMLGLLGGLLQVHLHYPLSIPGHHGLEWMALLLFGRCLSDQRRAATILAGAAAASYLAQTPFLNLAHDVKPALIFLLTGACTDLLYRFGRQRLGLLLTGILVGGLAFVTKPLIMYGVYLLTDLQVGMFVKHPDYLPFLSHLLFGATGGCGGALLARAALKQGRERGESTS